MLIRMRSINEVSLAVASIRTDLELHDHKYVNNFGHAQQATFFQPAHKPKYTKYISKYKYKFVKNFGHAKQGQTFSS